MFKKNGFSLLSLVITIALMVILGGMVFIWIDPIARVNAAKDVVRKNDVLNINLALNKYADDHQGELPITDTITSNKKVLCSTAATLACGVSSQTCITISDNSFFSNYLAALPVDPDLTSTANTGYYLVKDSNNNLEVGSCVTSTIYVSSGR